MALSVFKVAEPFTREAYLSLAQVQVLAVEHNLEHVIVIQYAHDKNLMNPPTPSEVN